MQLSHFSLLHAAFMFLVLFTNLQVFAQAGTTEPKQKPPHKVETFNFKEKQDEMQVLIKKQSPRLERLLSKVEINTKKLNVVVDFLQYPKNVKAYRDTSIKQLVEIRKLNDDHYREMQDLFFQWFPFSRHLMAVYTRYGEHLASNKIDEDMKTFITSYRTNNEMLEKIQLKIQDVYNECDFLLNTKLN